MRLANCTSGVNEYVPLNTPPCTVPTHRISPASAFMRASIVAPSRPRSFGSIPLHLLHCISEPPSWHRPPDAHAPRPQWNDNLPSARSASIEQPPDVSA